MKKYLFALIILGITSCSDSVEPSPSGVPCNGSHTTRVGALCGDGSFSSATGSGACSSHGGVKEWYCK